MRYKDVPPLESFNLQAPGKSVFIALLFGLLLKKLKIEIEIELSLFDHNFKTVSF